MTPLRTFAVILGASLSDASAPQLLRKEHLPPSSALGLDAEARWATFEAAHAQRLAAFGGPRAPSGHHVDHLTGFAAAAAEMQALMTSPPEVFFTSTPPPEEVPDEVGQEQCAAAGPLCRKVVDFLAERLPATATEKTEFLCGHDALDCVAQHMDKCSFFHAQVVRLQSQWSCEALACSSKGLDCQKAVQLLDTDDLQLTLDEKQHKTRFLCSDAGLKCITDHRDSCTSAFEIVSMAHDLRHCDRVRCTDAGPGCQRAVEYLTKDDIGNLTHRKKAENQAKWDYLCSDESLTCLEEHLERCQRYHDFLKGAFGNGQCNFVQCAKAGPECKRAVMYLSQADEEHSDEERKQKHAYLCGDTPVACLSSTDQCSPYKEMLRQVKESECVTKPVVKATIPPTAEILDARSDAAHAAVQAVVKAHVGPATAKEDAELAAAKAAEEAQKREEKRMLAKAQAISEGRDLEETSDKTKEAEDKKPEDKKAQGAALAAGVVVCLALAGAGFFYWRRRKAKGAGKFEKGVPPKPKKPLPARLKGKRGEGTAAEKSADEADTSSKGVVAGTMARFQRFANMASVASFSRFRKPKSKDEEAEGKESGVEPPSPGNEPEDAAEASAKEDTAEAKEKPPEASGASEPPLPPPAAPIFSGGEATSDKEGAPAPAEAAPAAPAETAEAEQEPKEY